MIVRGLEFASGGSKSVVPSVGRSCRRSSVGDATRATMVASRDDEENGVIARVHVAARARRGSTASRAEVERHCARFVRDVKGGVDDARADARVTSRRARRSREVIIAPR